MPGASGGRRPQTPQYAGMQRDLETGGRTQQNVHASDPAIAPGREQPSTGPHPDPKRIPHLHPRRIPRPRDPMTRTLASRTSREDSLPLALLLHKKWASLKVRSRLRFGTGPKGHGDCSACRPRKCQPTLRRSVKMSSARSTQHPKGQGLWPFKSSPRKNGESKEKQSSRRSKTMRRKGSKLFPGQQRRWSSQMMARKPSMSPVRHRGLQARWSSLALVYRIQR